MEKDSFQDVDPDHLLILCIEGNGSEKDYEKAWYWIHKNEENHRYYEKLRDAWLASSLNRPVAKEQIEKSWKRVRPKMENSIPFEKNNKSFPGTGIYNISIRFMKIAALLLFTFLLGSVSTRLFLSRPIEKQNLPFFTVEAPRGAKSFVTLTDGTRVWLNAGSKLRYSSNYNQQNRDIYLQGEGYFEVAKNKNVPFLVHSSGIVIRAVGTAFNVKAYSDDGLVETTLVEGVVSIESKNKAGQKETIILNPNQKASYNTTEKALVVKNAIINQSEDKEINKIVARPGKLVVAKNINTPIYTSWKDKRWIFQKESLENFAVRLERLYDVKVIFKDEFLKDYNLSGSFEQETIEQVLDAIRMTIPMDYSITHNKVTLSVNHDLKTRFEKILKHNTELN